MVHIFTRDMVGAPGRGTWWGTWRISSLKIDTWSVFKEEMNILLAHSHIRIYVLLEIKAVFSQFSVFEFAFSSPFQTPRAVFKSLRAIQEFVCFLFFLFRGFEDASSAPSSRATQQRLPLPVRLHFYQGGCPLRIAASYSPAQEHIELIIQLHLLG